MMPMRTGRLEWQHYRGEEKRVWGEPLEGSFGNPGKRKKCDARLMVGKEEVGTRVRDALKEKLRRFMTD